MLDVATGIARSFIRNEDDLAYEDILDLVSKRMKSKFGVIAYIDKNGDLINTSYTSSIWDVCKIQGKKVNLGKKNCWSGLWGDALLEVETKVKNDGSGFKVPDGHVKIDSFICSPIVFKQDVIGIISLANKEDGYNKDDIRLLEMICQTMAPILHERLEREKTLSILKQTRKAIFDMMNYANMFVLILDDKMHIKFINKSLVKLLGYNKIKELVGRCWLDFIPLEEHAKIKNIHHHIISDSFYANDFKEVENTLVKKDGKKIDVKWFNTQINTKYHWSFSIAIPYMDAKVAITEDSIRAYYEDIIKRDRTMILSIRDTIVNKTKTADTCEPNI